jgi:hypothetical protein
MPKDHESIAGMLQALEHSLDLSDRLTVVVRQVIAAHHHERLLDAATVAQYEEQLRTVGDQRAQAQRAIAQWWASIGRDAAQ